MQNIKDYFWFVKKSQDYMEGYNKVLVFFASLILGFKFIKLQNDFKKNVKVTFK